MEKKEIDLLRSPNLIVLSKQNFTAMQKDIFTLAISQLEVGINVNKDLFQNKTVTVPLKMLTEMSERNYSRLKSECTNMAQKQIVIADDAKQQFEVICVFPRIKFEKGVISLTMFADVAQKFLELKQGYSAYYVRESLSLDTFNKKRMYEILSIFKNREYPEWFVLDSELKQLLGVVEEKGKKDIYKGRHKLFKERVIDLCVNAINEQTSLRIEYRREQKEGEWGTRFFILNKLKLGEPKKKEPLEAYIATLDERKRNLLKMLQELLVRMDMIKVILADESLTKQAFKWFYENADNLKNKKYKNPAGLLLAILGLVDIKVSKPKTK